MTDESQDIQFFDMYEVLKMVKNFFCSVNLNRFQLVKLLYLNLNYLNLNFE